MRSPDRRRASGGETLSRAGGEATTAGAAGAAGNCPPSWRRRPVPQAPQAPPLVRRSKRIATARHARRARPTAGLDSLVEPGLYAVVALAAVQRRGARPPPRVPAPGCTRPSAAPRRCGGGAYGPDLPYALSDDYDPAEVRMMVPRPYRCAAADAY